VAKEIFKNIVPEGRHHMIIQNLFHFLEQTDAERAFQAFESEEGIVTCESFENWLVNVVRERKALSLTLSDTKTAIRSLSRLLDWVVGCIIVLMSFFVFNINVQKLLVVTSGSFLASIFVFGNMCKTVFESIVFLFVSYPFDVSDIIKVDGQTYVVEEMQLLSTIVLAADNSKVYFNNNQLALKVISNYYRSPDQIELIDLALGWGTPSNKIDDIRACVLRFLQANPKQWHPKVTLNMRIFEAEKLHFTFMVQHRVNFQQLDVRLANKNRLMTTVMKALSELELITNGETKIRIMAEENYQQAPSQKSPVFQHSIARG
jgi:small-conductance mechanosensitive channel